MIKEFRCLSHFCSISKPSSDIAYWLVAVSDLSGHSRASKWQHLHFADQWLALEKKGEKGQKSGDKRGDRQEEWYGEEELSVKSKGRGLN